MATTRIISMHVSQGKTIADCLTDRIDYSKNPDKTQGGELISAYECDPKTADAEFLYSKRQYKTLTGREQQSDVIAYQVRQSFRPGEITPEEANRIGYEFAKRFLKGRHAFLVCTHTDKKHIHNHIYWNSTALDCTRKFKNFIGSYRAVRRLSDLICAEHRLSVVENPQKHGLSYNKWRGGHDKLSNRDLLRMAIDAALEKQPKDFDALLALLKDCGYSVARKGRLSLRHENQKQSIRLDSLGEGYSEQELRAVLAGSRTHKPFVRKKYPKRRERATLIADIEAKLNAGKGYRYDQAMKVIKLKQMAKTLIYLEEKGFANFDALADAAADAEKRFYDLKAAIKAAEARMGEIQTLRTHIMNYSRTRSVYTGYRKAGYSKKYLAEHEGDILIHKAAKKAFDAFGLKKLPTVRSLNEEFARLMAEKKAAYAEYHRAQERMRELLIHKANAAYLLGLDVPCPPPGFEPLPTMVQVPLIGSIACGTPITAEQNIECYIGVPAAWHADFALTCHGDSMSPTICNGDIVCIRCQPEVEQGEIAAVRVGEEATLKHFHRQGDAVMLLADNAAVCPPMFYAGEQLSELHIEGKAVGLCRGL